MINTTTEVQLLPFTERHKEVFCGCGLERPRNHCIPVEGIINRVSRRSKVINLFYLTDRNFTDMNRVNLSYFNTILSNGFTRQFHKKGVPIRTLLSHLNEIMLIQSVLRGGVRVRKGHPKPKSWNATAPSKFRNVTDTWDVNDAMFIRSHLLCDSRMITGISKKKCETRRITTWNLCDIHRESSFHNLANSIQIAVLFRVNTRIPKGTV